MSEKMIEIENSSAEEQAISWIPAFNAGEKRKMTETEADRVLWNPNFKAVEVEEPKKKTESKKK